MLQTIQPGIGFALIQTPCSTSMTSFELFTPPAAKVFESFNEDSDALLKPASLCITVSSCALAALGARPVVDVAGIGAIPLSSRTSSLVKNT